MHAITDDHRVRVFVYGTLRRGGDNQHYLTAARYLGGHVTAPCYTLYDTGPFPAAVAGGSTPIRGEVYAVTRREFLLLDRLEDYPRDYTRRRIPTPYGAAWMYLWVAEIDPRWRRLDGDWFRR